MHVPFMREALALVCARQALVDKPELAKKIVDAIMEKRNGAVVPAEK